MEPTDSEYLMPVTGRPPAVFVRGRGSWLWDAQGNRYLDFVQGWAVNALGHAPEEIAAALRDQAALLLTASPAYYTDPELRLARRLAQLTGLDQVHFACTGAEANEAAVKLARKWGRLHRDGAYEIVTTHNAFHGRTLAMMAASGKPGWDQLFPPLPPGFRRVAFGALDAVAQAIGSHTAAVMVEPIQGEGGVVVPPDGYLTELRRLTRDRGVLLILDEVQTGMGRTGRLFAFEHERVRPDILTLGKGLGAGVPLSAVLAGGAASCFEHGDQGGTLHGNALMTAVGERVLASVAEPAFLDHVAAMGRHLGCGLEQLVSRRSLAGARGRGLLWAVDLGDDRAARVRDAAHGRGLLVNAARPHLVRLMPSLRVTADEIDRALELLDASVTEARAGARSAA